MEDPAIRLMRLAVGGATRPDSFTGMDRRFSAALDQMIAAAPPEVQQQMKIGSGYRSIERQRQLWEASDKSGKMVARPGGSQHKFGRAADLKYLGDEAKSWVHANAADYGLSFPMDYEPWHIELAGARGMSKPARQPAGPDERTPVDQGGGYVTAPEMAGTINPAEQLLQKITGGQGGQPGAFQYQPSWIENQDFGAKALLNDVFSGQNPMKRLAYQGLSKLFRVI
jgi:hypothetical protein